MTIAALAAVKTMLAASSAFALPVAQVADRMMGPRGCLLTFHRLAPSALWPTLPNRDFYVDAGFLDTLLGYLTSQGWDVVTMEEAARRAAAGPSQGRYVNISIDDCYRDTYELLVPLFRRHKVPVTLFVTTGIPDGTLSLWAAGLEEALRLRDRVVVGSDVLELSSAEQRRDAFARIATRWDGPDAATHYQAFCTDNGIDRDAMHWRHAISWDMLAELAADPLVEIGAHTVSHPRISALPPEQAHDELMQSRQRLTERLGIPIRHFAFPYGRSGDCSARDFDLAREAGFATAATTRKGVVQAGQNPFCLPRNTINGSDRSLMMMEMHLTGLSGVAARIAGRV